MTTAAELQPKILTVRAAMASWRTAIAYVSAQDQQEQILGAYNTFAKIVDAWAGKQRDEVLAGKRSLATWQTYGDELQKQAELFQGQIDWVARYSALADTLGEASQAVLRPLDAKVAELRSDLNGLLVAQAKFDADKKALEPIRKKLSVEVRDLYWGPPAAKAKASLGTLQTIVQGLEAGLRALHGGGSADFANLAKLSGGLGNPFVGVAGAFAVIAIAASIAVSLWAFFKHADEVARVERQKAIIELAKTDPDAAKKLAGIFKDEGADGTPTIVIVLATIGALSATAIGLYLWSKRGQPARKVNPRPRKAPAKPRKRRRQEAHA
ncbi:MAG: hypothetical protein WC969_15255 [Elusimicrobiota bacterium]|jgi:hypothetical protein